MSVFPGMNILENFGLVDVNLIRRVYLPEDMLQSLQRGADLNRLPGIEQVTEDIVADLNEIVRTRVRSLGGNCLIGYKISINGFEQILEENKVYLIMSAIGDAVFLESEPTLIWRIPSITWALPIIRWEKRKKSSSIMRKRSSIISEPSICLRSFMGPKTT